MIDINFIRQNPSLVQKKALEKGIKDISIDHLLKIDSAYRELNTEVQNLQSERNTYAKAASNAVEEEKINIIKKGKEIKEILAKKEAALTSLKEELRLELLRFPTSHMMMSKLEKMIPKMMSSKQLGKKPHLISLQKITLIWAKHWI